MKMVEAKNLSHEYIERDEEGNVAKIFNAIENIDIDVIKGQFISILGHNGSGKSTFAKHLNALLYPTEGTLFVGGLDCNNKKNTFDIRKNVGMVFQNPDNQIIASVVDEDVGFGPENIGIPTNEIIKRVEKSLKAVRMWKYKNKSPNNLSGGQKQRTAIAGVLAMEPSCIVFDEPTAMLDPNGRKEVIKVAKELNKEKNITIILITHYMEEVVESDYVYVMDKGHVVMRGTPKEIFSEEEALNKYRLSLPQITELARELREEGMNIPKGILTKEELILSLKRLKKEIS